MKSSLVIKVCLLSSGSVESTPLAAGYERRQRRKASMTDEQEGSEESDGDEGPVVDGREEAENVSEVLKEREDEIEAGRRIGNRRKAMQERPHAK